MHDLDPCLVGRVDEASDVGNRLPPGLLRQSRNAAMLTEHTALALLSDQGGVHRLDKLPG